MDEHMHSTVLTVDGGIGRILNKEPFDAHTDPLFRHLKILKFVDVYYLHLYRWTYVLL